MKKDKLFRETAFGGYKREDVLNYIESMDKAHRAALDELNERILELNEALTNATKKNQALEQELEIKTAFAVQAEEWKTRLEEKEAEINELNSRCDALSAQNEEAKDLIEKSKQGFACERLQDGVCAAVTEQAELILARAEAEAQKKISDAEEQASGILLKARMESQSMITEAEGQTEALAQQISEEAHQIITMTVNEAKEIIGAAKAQSNVILNDSARSIGKIKGNLSSMQMVVKNIENELKSARASLSENILKKED